MKELRVFTCIKILRKGFIKLSCESEFLFTRVKKIFV